MSTCSEKPYTLFAISAELVRTKDIGLFVNELAQYCLQFNLSGLYPNKPTVPCAYNYMCREFRPLEKYPNDPFPIKLHENSRVLSFYKQIFGHEPIMASSTSSYSSTFNDQESRDIWASSTTSSYYPSSTYEYATGDSIYIDPSRQRDNQSFQINKGNHFPTNLDLKLFLIIILTLMIVSTVIGNILVCLSVILVPKLRLPSNYLLVSFMRLKIKGGPCPQSRNFF